MSRHESQDGGGAQSGGGEPPAVECAVCADEPGTPQAVLVNDGGGGEVNICDGCLERALSTPMRDCPYCERTGVGGDYSIIRLGVVAFGLVCKDCYYGIRERQTKLTGSGGSNE